MKKLRRIALIGAAVAGAVAFRRKRRQPIPCPASQSWVLENRLARAHARRVIQHLHLSPGMRVLDVGCGVGRLSIPIAERIAPAGEVVALDLQPEMLEKLSKRAAERGVNNIRTILGGAGDGKVGEVGFDLALLVSVLGEIPVERRGAALQEIYDALRPGGILTVTEALPDPDYQSRGAVRQMTEQAGFRQKDERREWLGFTISFFKP